MISVEQLEPVPNFSAGARVGHTDWWRELLVLIAVVFVVFVGSLPMLVVLSRSLAVQQRGLDTTNIVPAEVGISNIVYVVLVLLPLVLGLFALVVLVHWLHHRSWRTLVRPLHATLRWGRLGRATVVWLILLLLGELVLYQFQPAAYAFAFEPARFWPMLGVLLALIPLQIAFEELAIRGYLHQVVVHHTRWPLLGVVVSSALFGVLHFANPEVAKFGLTLMAGYYIGVGLFLATISVFDNGLELALGVHLATNLYSTVAVNLKGSALPTAPIFEQLTYHAPSALAMFVVQASLFFWAFAKTSHWSLDAFKRLPATSKPSFF